MRKLTLILIIHCLILGLLFILRTQDCFAQPLTWEKVMAGNNQGIFRKAAQTSDGGYIATGSNRIGIYYKMYTVKFNRYGDTLWIKYYDPNLNYDYHSYWVEKTYDKGFIIGGSGNSEAYIVKTDAVGNLQWYKVYPDGWQTRCVKETADKGFILAIRTDTYGPTDDIMIVKTDSIGNLIWKKIFVDNSSTDYAWEIREVGTSGYAVIGTKWPLSDSADVYFMRLNNNGDTLWTKRMGGSRGDAGFSVDLTGDGGYIIGGSSLSFNNFGYLLSYIVKTDSLGNIQWQRTYSTAYNEMCSSIKVVPGKGYIFCGASDSTVQSYERAFIRMIDFSGNIIRQKFYRAGDESNSFESVELTADGGFVFSGYANYVIAGPQAYIVRTDSLGNISPIGINFFSNEIPKEAILYQNYPNPFNPVTTIKYDIPKDGNVEIKIYDITGREVFSINEYKQSGSYSVTFDGTNFASGIYLYRIESGDYTETRKMVLIK